MTEMIIARLDDALSALAQGSGQSQSLNVVRRWQSAMQKLPQANMTLISVAGEYAAELAHQALSSEKKRDDFLRQRHPGR